MSLTKAFKSGDDESLKKLVGSADFDPCQFDPKTGETVLHLLVKYDYQAALKTFLLRMQTIDAENRPNIDAKDKEGQVAVRLDTRHLS